MIIETSFTSKDGSECLIRGQSNAVEAIENMFEAAGIDWNEAVGTWDAGYYRKTKTSPYGKMCRKPDACRNKGYCPLDPTCGD